jgi:hypothetical protein
VWSESQSVFAQISPAISAMCRDYGPFLANGWRLPSLMGQKTNHYDVAFTAPKQRHAHQSVLFMRHATNDVKMTRDEIHMRLDEVSWQSSRVIRVPDGGIKITMVHSNLLAELPHNRFICGPRSGEAN